MSSRGTSQERETYFAGYGDRVGSGVALAPATWRGGEIVTDPNFVNKSLKPRRMFYSPIGDGVVAADGVELKRLPPDLTPKVEVIHQTTVERGERGKAGKRVIEKTWTTGGAPDGLNSTFSSEYGGGSGRESRATNAASPFASLTDPLGLGSGAAAPAPAPAAPATSGYGTGSSRPDTGLGDKFPSLADKFPTAPAPARDPLSTLGSTRSAPVDLYDKARTRNQDPLNGLADNYGSGPRGYPTSGRSSTTSALVSEPGYRYEINRYERISNPRELIHQFATTTPIQTIDGYESLPDAGTITRTLKQQYSKTTEESYAPYPPYTAGSHGVSPNKFVRQLRDETLTSSQRAANQNMQPLNPKDSAADQRIHEIERNVNRQLSANPEVDALTNRLVTGLNVGHPTSPRRY